MFSFETEEEREKRFNASYERRREEVNRVNKRYWGKHKERLKKQKKVYNALHKDYYQLHKKVMKKQMKKYQQSEKGRLTFSRTKRKRKNQMGFHPISCSIPVPFDWHHVNPIDVVAVPRSIHRSVRHRCGDTKMEGVIG